MPKKRSTAVRELPAVLHIYCEGEKTEPNYLKKYLDKTHPGNNRAKLIKIEATKKNTPKQLVDVAVEHKKRSTCPKGDQFWVVFDRESIAKYPDSLHDHAYTKAKDNDVNIALSNVCFELWILLHFKENSASYTDYADLMGKSNLKNELKNIGIHNYEKGESKIFDLIQGNIATARLRAVTMNDEIKSHAPKNKDKPYQLNPYTDMPKLLDAIDAFF